MRRQPGATRVELPAASEVCLTCGIPLDSEYFDKSDLSPAPDLGAQVLLASVELPPQYCGVLQYFSQYTDSQARKPELIATPGLLWTILSNGRPLYPYLAFERILNPWGYGSFQTGIRLEDGATLEFVVRRVSADPTPGDPIRQVGGRLVGRYWYNDAYGDGVRHRA